MHVHAAPLAALLCAAILSIGPTATQAQQSRAGVYVGVHTATLQYEYHGVMLEEESYRTTVFGVLVEHPLGGGLWLRAGGQLTLYSDGEILIMDINDAAGGTRHMGSFNNRFMLEVPVTVKLPLSDGVFRPFLYAGPVLVLAVPPEDLWDQELTPGDSGREYPLSSLHTGVTAGAGFEISLASSSMLTAAFSVTQLVRPSIDTPVLRVRNTPHLQLTVGVLFSLDTENWQ